MKTSPESSLISIITCEHNGNNLIVFACLKQLFDINPPATLYSPNDKGIVIWSEKTVVQWLYYGSDLEIETLWNKIITDGFVNLQGKRYIFTKSPAVTQCEEKKGDSLYLKYESDDLPRFLLEENNLKIIQGYQADESKKIKPIKPPGLLPDGFLFNNLSKRFRACKLNRGVSYNFRGVRVNKDDNEPTEMIGFIQADLQKHEYSVEFVSKEGLLLGSSDVDKTSGTFRAPLSAPGSNARFILKDKADQVEDYSYALLKGTNLDIQVANKTFKDIFERETMINSVRKNDFANPLAYTWHQELFASEVDGKIDLSDYIKKLLNYLGEDILICDPYFFGNIPPKTDSEKNSFSIFLNALFSSAIDHKISSLKLLGYWGRANKIINDQKEQYFENVKINIENLTRQNNFETYLPSNTIQLIQAPVEFHSRLWLGFKNMDGKKIVDEDKIFFVSNSINGIFNTGEVDFVPCTNTLQIQRISAKYDNLLRTATETYLIN